MAFQQTDSFFGKSFSAPFLADEYANFGAVMVQVEVGDICHTDCAVTVVLNHQPQLLVGIEVVGARGYVLLDLITGVGAGGKTGVPQGTVVFIA